MKTKFTKNEQMVIDVMHGVRPTKDLYYKNSKITITKKQVDIAVESLKQKGVIYKDEENILQFSPNSKVLKVFIICSVRGASDEYRTKLETYVSGLEKKGICVHLPHRDTNQNASGIDICSQNAKAIKGADEVHIFYNSNSQGTHFDMGVSFALGKKIVVVENEKYGEGKSYPRMLDEWKSKSR